MNGVLAALDAGILVVGSDGRVEHANRAACALVGRERLVGEAAGPLLDGVRRGADGEVRRGAGGSARHLVVARRDLDEPGAEVVLVSDVTERDRKLEERHRLERFAALMRTIGALSHEINNPLTSLMGRAQMLQMKQGNEPHVKKAAQVIEESSRRIADYIRELAQVVREGREEALERLIDIDYPES
jgi:signal transduction histidine kinase